jgi:tetratricopeptide (TPR) repeat protein
MSKTLLITFAAAFLVTGSLFASDTYKDTFAQAQKLEKARNYKNAQKNYAKALGFAKTDREKYKALFRQGKCFRLTGKWADAVKCFQQATALRGIASREIGNALLSEAEAYRHMKRYDKANEAANKVIAMKSTLSNHIVARTRLCKGDNLRDTGKLNEAIVEYNAILLTKTYPNYLASARRAKADILVAQKKYNKAFKEYQNIVGLTGAHINLRTGAANQMATVQRNLKKYDKSIKSSQIVLGMEKVFPPHTVDALLNMGYCLYEQKKYKKAIDAFKKVIASNAAINQKKLAKTWIYRMQKVKFPATTKNLVLNGNFKNGLLYWHFSSQTSGTVSHFPSGAPGGKSYIRIATSTQPIQVHQRGLKVVPGQTYLLSAYIRTKGLKDTSSGISASYAKIINLPASSSGWLHKEIVVSAKSSGMNIDILLSGGQLDVADVKLIPLSAKGEKESLTQRETFEQAFVPLCNIHYISYQTKQIPFYWAGKIPGDPNMIECVFSFKKARKTVRTPFGDGKVMLDLRGIGKGKDVVKVQVLEKKNGKELFADQYKIRVLDIPELPSSAKRLNNLVTEIFHGNIQSEYELSIPNPRYGWLFFRFQPTQNVPFKITLNGKEILNEKKLRKETVRLLEPKKYTLKLQGAQGKLTVRLIPEILLFPLQPSRWPGNERYNWTFAKKYMLPALTTVNVGGISDDELTELKSMGLKWFSNFGVYPSAKKNFRHDFLKRLGASPTYTNLKYDGMTLDESDYCAPATLDPYAWALRHFRNPRNIPLYSYIIHPPSPSNANIISAAINVSDGRGRILYEAYNRELRTEKDSDNYLFRMQHHAELYRKIVPDIFTQNLSFILGIFNDNPSSSLAHYPDIDFKYYLEMQVRMLAVNPSFRGFSGVGFWGAHAANEEILRWGFALMKHYAIEGRKDSLSERYGFRFSYGSLKNPGFEDGLRFWNANSLARAGQFKGFGAKSMGNHGEIYNVGDKFAILKRTKDGYGEIKQTITGLTPGKTYTLTFFTANYDDVKKRRVVPSRYNRMEYKIRNVKILKCFLARDYRRATSENNRYARINAHRILFKPEKKEAELIFSNKTAAPGKELVLNNIMVMPYFEKNGGE